MIQLEICVRLEKGQPVKKKLVLLVLVLGAVLSTFAQQKEDEQLANSAAVLRGLVGDRGLPTSILDRAKCIVIFPSVKKVAIGIGGSYGRGVIVCREGSEMNGGWGAPAMYKLDQGSIGVQLGSTATDFVLVVMSQRGVQQILSGNTKLGANAAVAAGPTGSQAAGYDASSNHVDVLTYSRAKGLFAGVSLEGASLESDDDANKSLYGKDISAKYIVLNCGVPPPEAANQLLSILNKTSPGPKEPPGCEGGTPGRNPKHP